MLDLLILLRSHVFRSCVGLNIVAHFFHWFATACSTWSIPDFLWSLKGLSRWPLWGWCTLLMPWKVYLYELATLFQVSKFCLIPKSFFCSLILASGVHSSPVLIFLFHLSSTGVPNQLLLNFLYLLCAQKSWNLLFSIHRLSTDHCMQLQPQSFLHFPASQYWQKMLMNTFSHHTYLLRASLGVFISHIRSSFFLSPRTHSRLSC